MFPHLELSSIVMTYLLGVVLVAARLGRGPAMLAVVLSVAALDFFFVPPYLSFAVEPRHLVTLAVMLIVALLISGLTVRVTRQAEAARERERRTAALYALYRELAGTHGITELLEVGVRHVLDVVGGQITILLPDDEGHLQTRATLMSAFRLDPNDVGVAQWAYEHGQLAGPGTDNLTRGEMLFVPLRASRGAVGVLGVRPSRPGALDDAEPRRLLEAFASQIALAIERSLLAEDAQRAQLRGEAERLRSSLLSSVSQDLRAPLTAITDAAGVLASGGETLAAATRKDLVETIHEEADRLSRLVSNLLDMTRLESGGAPVHRERQPLQGVVAAALGRMGRHLEGHPVSIGPSRHAPPRADRRGADRAGLLQPPRQRRQVHARGLSHRDHGGSIERRGHRVVRRSRSRAAGRHPRPRVREVLSGEAGGRPGWSGTRAHDLSGDRQRARRAHLGGESSRRWPRVPVHASTLREAAERPRVTSSHAPVELAPR